MSPPTSPQTGSPETKNSTGPDAPDDALTAAVRWRALGEEAALATVIATWDGAPCPVGSQMAVAASGAIAGSLSAGCVEGSVVAQALQVIGDGEPRVVDYRVTDDLAAAGLAGGGRMQVLIRAIGRSRDRRDLLERAQRARSERRPVALVTDLITGLQTLVFDTVSHGGFGLDGEALDAVTRCLAAGRSARVEAGEDLRLFVQVFVPPRPPAA